MLNFLKHLRGKPNFKLVGVVMCVCVCLSTSVELNVQFVIDFNVQLLNLYHNFTYLGTSFLRVVVTLNLLHY